MLKYLFWIIVVFALAVGAVYLFSYLDGSVFILLDSDNGSVVYHVSLKWVLYVLIATLVVGVISYYFISLIWKIPRQMSLSHQKRKRSNVLDDMNNTTISFFEGRYHRSLKLVDGLLKNKQTDVMRVSALIFGAQSANKIYDFEKRDFYLNQLGEKDLSNTVLLDLLRAEGALKEQNYSKFNEYCDDVKWHNPKLTALAQLQLEYGRQINDADIILKSLEQLKRNNAIVDNEYQKYELKAYEIKLDQIHSSELLKKYWRNLPGSLKNNNAIIVRIGQKYCHLQDYQGAVDWSLDEYPNTKVSQLFKIISSSFSYLSEKSQNKVLRVLEGWLENDRENSDLLLLLGDLAYQNELWGKAQGYLEVGVTNRPTTAGWMTLSKLYVQQGEYEKANDANAKALELLDTD
ncbi:MAG: hypothetical protein GKC53_02145 [Neisseriaceae bacterium]|nr:MAG: hypothetical protein GKC53_02145 [Neisseriaceae bacterium]